MKSRSIAALWAVACIVISSTAASAQNDDWNTQVQQVAPGWYKMQPYSSISADEFLSGHLEHLGLDPRQDAYRIIQEWTDELGIKHYRLQQTHRQVVVEGAEFLLHEKNNRLVTANGEVVTGLQKTAHPGISSSEALDKAEEYVEAENCLHKNPAQITYLKNILGKNVEVVADPQLVFTDPDYSGKGENYRLAYKLDLYALQPVSRQWVFVDAHSGEVIHSLNQIHTTNDTGIAYTRYHGIRPIITDSFANGLYRLRQSVSGGGIETYDMNNNTNYNLAVDFIDSNNIWNNFNAQQDEVATDAHWGARATYEYFLNQHGRNSYDDQGSKLVSFVHYDSNYVNAFWNGIFMTYGDGNAAYGPLTALDVVAHEIAHGVTGNSAGLIYRGESGALNESFSDIFGAAVEFLNDSADADWIIGEEMNANGLRNMANPKPYGDPDTYRGINWGYGVFIDNGYVHSNSGVQNFWFHLLTDGGTGVNDLGAAYTVNGIGVIKAGAIAYRNLSTYLTTTSDHFDARMGAIQSASDLYGACSPEEIETANAWYAVGLGPPKSENDLAIQELLVDNFLCGGDTSESIGVVIRNLSCSQNIPDGDTLRLSFASNNGPVTTEDFVLNSSLAPGNTVIYNFNAGIDLSQPGTNLVNVAVNYPQDPSSFNDSLLRIPVENRQIQNADFGLVNIISPVSNCELGDSTDLVVRIFFNGCDSISAGSPINFQYRLGNGSVQTASYTLKQNLYTLDTLVVAIPDLLDLSAGGRTQMNLELANQNDPNPANNRITNYSFTSPLSISDRLITFEKFQVRDSLAVFEASQADLVLNSPLANAKGFFGMLMTGGNAIDYPQGIEFPGANDVWAVNPNFFSSACACVDATDMIDVSLSFDLRQRFSRIYQQVLRQRMPYASAFRVTVNGKQEGNTMTANTPQQDSFRILTYDLSQYAGSEFSLCFEAKTLMRRGFNIITNDGDEVHIDNIFINGEYIGMDEFDESGRAGVSVYPNPSTGRIFIRNTFEQPKDVQLAIRDLSGKLLHEESQEWQSSEVASMNLELPSGTYLLKWKTGESGNTLKLTIH